MHKEWSSEGCERIVFITETDKRENPGENLWWDWVWGRGGWGESVELTADHDILFCFFFLPPCHFYSCPPRADGHLRGGGATSLLQQEQNRGTVANRQVLLFSWAGGGHHQGRAVVCRRYAPTFFIHRLNVVTVQSEYIWVIFMFHFHTTVRN